MTGSSASARRSPKSNPQGAAGRSRPLRGQSQRAARPASPAPLPVRLQLFLSQAGLASRRAAESLILAGRVTVNGTVVRELGTKVHPDRDTVLLDGTPVHRKKKIYVALNKPRGCLSTCHDPQNRPTILSLLPKEWHHLRPVGRLDQESEGLLLLSNDGDFCLRLTHPRFGVTKLYRVEILGKIRPELLQSLERGVEHRGETLRARAARILAVGGKRSRVEIELAEGKNREIRRMFAVLGYEVRRLKRIQIGPITVRHLRPGQWRTLTDREISSLLQTV